MIALLALFAAAAFAKKKHRHHSRPTLIPAGSGDRDTESLSKMVKALEPAVRQGVRRHMKAKIEKKNRKANDRLYRMALLTHLGYDASPFLSKRASTHILLNRLAPFD